MEKTSLVLWSGSARSGKMTCIPALRHPVPHTHTEQFRHDIHPLQHRMECNEIFLCIDEVFLFTFTATYTVSYAFHNPISRLSGDKIASELNHCPVTQLLFVRVLVQQSFHQQQHLLLLYPSTHTRTHTNVGKGFAFVSPPPFIRVQPSFTPILQDKHGTTIFLTFFLLCVDSVRYRETAFTSRRLLCNTTQ